MSMKRIIEYLIVTIGSYVLILLTHDNIVSVDCFSFGNDIPFGHQKSVNHVQCHRLVSRLSRARHDLTAKSTNDEYNENVVNPKKTKKRIILRKKRPTKPSSQEDDDHQKDDNHKSKIVDKSIFTKLEFRSNNQNINQDDDSIGFFHQEIKRALTEDLKVTHMTQVQARTFVPIAIEKNDVVVKARTGTGKTLAFLLPSLYQIIEQQQNNDAFMDDEVDVLIISPTRELATQIANVAKQLTKYHHQMPVQSMVGGTSIGRDKALFQREIPRILVVTPGRLMDHLQPTNNQQHPQYKKTNTLYTKALSNVKILILDEADRLLTSSNFAKEIQQILSYIPRPKQRQTLLFSATLSHSMLSLNNNNNNNKSQKDNDKFKRSKRTHIKNLLKDDAVMIDCDDGTEIAENGTVNIQEATHKSLSSKESNDNSPILNRSVEHSYIILPEYKNFVKNVVNILEHIINSSNEKGNNDIVNGIDENKKVIVFFPTARMVGFIAQILSSLHLTTSMSSIRIFEMHSKKSQGFRTKTSQEFQRCKQGILLTSDVSARGTYINSKIINGIISLLYSFWNIFFINYILYN